MEKEKILRYADSIIKSEGNSGNISTYLSEGIQNNKSTLDLLQIITDNREFIRFRTINGVDVNSNNKTEEEWKSSIKDRNRLINWLSNYLYTEDGGLWYDRDGICNIIETTGAYRNDHLRKARLKFFDGEDIKEGDSLAIKKQLAIRKWYSEEKLIIQDLYDTIMSLPEGDLQKSTVEDFNIECARVTRKYFEWGKVNTEINGFKNQPETTFLLPDPLNNKFFEISF